MHTKNFEKKVFSDQYLKIYIFSFKRFHYSPFQLGFLLSKKAFKASYPPGDAKEDWQIINEIAEMINNRKLFNDKEELESSMFNYLNLKKEKQKSNIIKNIDQNEFENENLKIKFKDYYFSNVIARASKTMLDCNNSKLDIKHTGTEG